MIDEALQTQAALYALDALPPDEAAAFHARLRETPGLAELVAEYQEAASAVAETAPEIAPPPGLRKRIMASIEDRSVPAASRRMVWLPWAIAAGFAFSAGGLYVENQRLTSENGTRAIAIADLTQEIAKANEDGSEKQSALMDLTQQLAKANKAGAEKDLLAETLRQQLVDLQKRDTIAETQVATLTSKLDGSYLASIAWDNSSQEGILHVRRLPAAQNGKNYQLWVIDPKNAAPVSAGVFTVQPDGSATIRFSPTQKVSSATAFAVSVEKAGGSESPQGPVVLSN